jgi:hypothetical protein
MIFLIQLKGETASWNSVPQKAVMADLRKIEFANSSMFEHPILPESDDRL